MIVIQTIAKINAMHIDDNIDSRNIDERHR